MSSVPSPSPVDANPEVSVEDRWLVRLSPLPKGEATINLTAQAGDVTAFEIGRALLKVGMMFMNDPNARIPTETELKASAAAQALVKESPAVRLVVKDGAQVWLGERALESGVLTELVALGWLDAGPVPEGVKRGCDYAQDQEAFKAAYLADDEA